MIWMDNFKNFYQAIEATRTTSEYAKPLVYI
jgi:hypothetical protein